MRGISIPWSIRIPGDLGRGTALERMCWCESEFPATCILRTALCRGPCRAVTVKLVSRPVIHRDGGAATPLQSWAWWEVLGAPTSSAEGAEQGQGWEWKCGWEEDHVYPQHPDPCAWS